MDDILMKIANYGFPMVVAVFLLVRIESKLEALTDAISRLEQVLNVYLRMPNAEAVPAAGDPPVVSRVVATAVEH